ncbi:hypothetical protein [Pseudomonas putida]|uniref:Uncharacterized protein n=1 Tax=Pseudomonas putida TaxID=303 RepID=A0AAD0PEE0_PSEPU|nr:hypothetical protein [Pseudomonas putida]ANC02673.1 hypothetical protein AB688_11305 [Pseudomonas putida]AXA24353.1 hypothetical protein C1S65_09610 [Pseudomonas putida]
MGALQREKVIVLGSQCDLSTDPEKHAAKLVSMAFECRRRSRVDDLQLSDVLELAEAARMWALGCADM